MARRYFSGDVPFWRIAEYYGCSVTDLQVLLGIPQFKAVPDASRSQRGYRGTHNTIKRASVPSTDSATTGTANSEPDLFAGFDRLQEQL